MGIVISVSEAELEKFPEEAPESTGQQEQSRETSYAQGTVKCLLLVDTCPTPELLDRIRRGRVASMIGKSPKGGSDNRDNRFQKNKVCKQPVNSYSKRPVEYSKRPINSHSKRPVNCYSKRPNCYSK